MRIEGDNFKICKSTVAENNMINITPKAKSFKGTEDFWTLLTPKNMN